MYYFSYGSNMSTPRIRKRVPSPKVIAVARLDGHQLRYHKASKDGSGKCDIFETRVHTDVVYGIVFEIDPNEKPNLDRAEGLGYGYEQKSVQITSTDNQTLTATTYYATKIDERLRPYLWYKEHVLRGAREHLLPPDYVKKIESVAAESDPDQKRHDRELSIYR